MRPHSLPLSEAVHRPAIESPAAQAPDRRRFVRWLVLAGFALAVIGVIDPPLPRFGASEPAVAGVRVRSAAVVVRAGRDGVPAGDLAYLAVLPGGELIVTDRARRVVTRFDAAGRRQAEVGPRLPGGFDLGEPAGVAAGNGRVYVVDRGSPPRVLRLSAALDGPSLPPIDLQPFGTYGVNGAAVDPAGNLFVADTGRNRLLVFGADGAYRRELGGSGKSPGQFTQPMALTFTPDGILYVADWENARIQRFDPSLMVTDAWATGFRSFGVAVDASQRVYAPNSERRRVQVFSARGSPLAELGGSSDAPLELADARQAAMGPDGSLYVLGRDGIVRLQLEDMAPATVESDAVPRWLLWPALAVVMAAAGLVVPRGRYRRASPMH